MRFITLALLTCAAAIPEYAQTINVSGNWQFSAKSTNHALQYSATGPVTQSGNNIAGYLTISGNPCRASATFSGTLSGNTVTMTEDVSAQSVVFTGTVSADGSSVTGSYTAPTGGCTRGDTGTWSGTRLSAAMAGAGSMAHVASGNGWETTFTLVNMGTSSADAQLNFFDDNGGALELPLVVMEGGTNMNASEIRVNGVPAGGVRVIQTQNGAGVGSAQLTADGNFGGFAIFRYNQTGQEAVVPLETRSDSAYVLAFDNTPGIATGLALANVTSQAVNVSVVLKDETGSLVRSDTITLAANGHTSFMLAQNYGATVGIRGTVELQTPSGGQISVVGLRSNGNALTTLPVLAK